ncbi:Microspherule protein 1 [Plecturocebus cupreus]
MSSQDSDNQTLSVLQGRMVWYLMHSPKITLGRATNDNQIDVDLSLEGLAWKISWKQGVIKLKNKEHLSNNSVVEIASQRFTFLINQDLTALIRAEAAKITPQYNPQLRKACTYTLPAPPLDYLPPHLELPVAPPSTNADQVSSGPTTQEESGKAKAAKVPQAIRVHQICPLQAVGGEFGSTKEHSPFSLSDIKQAKVDLGKFLDDPDKYTGVLQGLGQFFKLDWKDIVLLLSQTLTSK